MRRVTRAIFSIAIAAVLISPALAADTINPEYEKALEISKSAAEALESYELDGTLSITTRVPTQPEPMQMEVALRGAARWPDRVMSSQSSSVFNLSLGVGAGRSWFHLGQRSVAYVGPELELSRTLDNAAEMSLESDDFFNFYTGIGSFLLNRDLVVEAKTGSETLILDGKEVVCQVFRSPADLEANPNAGPQGDKVFWFDPETGLVVQASISSKMMQQGMEMEQELVFRLDRLKLNQPVAEELFQFTPLAGTRVVSSLSRVMNPDSLVGEKAADVTFTDFDGNPVHLADYRGKVVFLDFWATWCGPCRMEMPHIQKLHEEMSESGDVVFLGASSEAQPTIQGFLAKNPYNFKMVMVRQEDAQKKFKVSSIPAGFVIDRDGVIRAHMIGAQTEEQLREALAKAGI